MTVLLETLNLKKIIFILYWKFLVKLSLKCFLFQQSIMPAIMMADPGNMRQFGDQTNGQAPTPGPYPGPEQGYPPEYVEKMKKMQDRERLRNMLTAWNANRLDLFELSMPNEVGFLSLVSSLSSQCQWHGTCISSGNQFLHFLARSPLSCDTLPSVSYDHAAVNRVKQILITIFYLARDVLQPLVWINSIVKTCCGGIQCVLLYQVVNLINYFIHTIHRILPHCIVW